MQLCPNCRIQNRDDAVTCVQCYHRLHPKSPAPSGAALPPSQGPQVGQAVLVPAGASGGSRASYAVPRSCPHCGNPDIRKVSAVHSDGSWHEATVGSVGTVGYINHVGTTVSGGITQSKTVGSTALAISLSPPPFPVAQKTSVWTLVGCGGVIAAILGLGFFGCVFARAGAPPGSESPDGGTVAFWGLWFFVAVIATGLLWRRALDLEQEYADRFQYDLSVYNQRMPVWDRCYYCPRCDMAFDPVLQRSAPSNSFGALMSGGQTPSIPQTFRQNP